MIYSIKKDDTDTLYEALSNGSYNNTKWKQMTEAENKTILASLKFAAERVGN
jgi:hypothetical protein